MTRFQIAAFLLFLLCMPCAAFAQASGGATAAPATAAQPASGVAAPAGCAPTGLFQAALPLFTAATSSESPSPWVFTPPRGGKNSEKILLCSCGGDCSGQTGCTCTSCSGCSFGDCLSCCFSGCASNCT